MKKFYTLLCAVSFVLASNAQEKILSLSVYDFSTETLSKTYTDSQKNSITFSVNEPQYKGNATFVYTATVDNPLNCIGGTPTIPSTGAKYAAAVMVGHVIAKPMESPFILIELPADDKVQEIELLGYATSGGAHLGVQSELICAFSPDSDPTIDESFLIDMDLEETTLGFNQANCAPKTKQTVPAGSKFIKLIATDNFGFTGVTSYACRPIIHAINIYAKDMGTGISKEEQAPLIQLFGRNLQLSEVADVTIYDITGKLVAQYKTIEDAYLDGLNSGVYIASATGNTGVRAVQKVIIE